MATISHNIRMLRNHFKMSQSQFATKIGNKTHNIGAWEEGRSTPSTKILQIISKEFSIPLNDLIQIELDELYFRSLKEDSAIYYNTESQSAKELISFLKKELEAKNEIIKSLIDMMKKKLLYVPSWGLRSLILKETKKGYHTDMIPR